MLGFLDHQPLGTRPRALRTKRQRRGDLLATADATRREHRYRRDLLDDLRPQHDRADLAAVSARLAALGDDDVNSGVGVLARLGRRTAQRGDLATGFVDALDHVRRRCAERVGDQRHLRVPQGDLDLRGGGRLGPAKELQRIVVAVVDRNAVVGEDLLGEVDVLLGHQRVERLFEHLWRQVGGVHALVLVRDDDVDPVGMVADVLSIQFSSISSCSGVKPTAPSTPNPPALLTATTTSRQWVKANIGNSIFRLCESFVIMQNCNTF